MRTIFTLIALLIAIATPSFASFVEVEADTVWVRINPGKAGSDITKADFSSAYAELDTMQFAVNGLFGQLIVEVSNDPTSWEATKLLNQSDSFDEVLDAAANLARYKNARKWTGWFDINGWIDYRLVDSGQCYVKFYLAKLDIHQDIHPFVESEIDDNRDDIDSLKLRVDYLELCSAGHDQMDVHSRRADRGLLSKIEDLEQQLVALKQQSSSQTVVKTYEEADLHFGIYVGATTTREAISPIATLFGNYRSVMGAAYGMHHLWSVDYGHNYWNDEYVDCGDQGSGVMVGWTPREQRDLFIFSGWHYETSKVLSDVWYLGESAKNNPVNGTEGLQLGLTYVSKNLMITGAATWGADRDMNSDSDTTVSYRLSVQLGHSIGF